MNFYTYFKNESKRLYNYISINYSSDYLLSRGINNLTLFRNNLLRLAFGFKNVNLSHFQIACFRVLPLDLPKEFYSGLWNYFFRTSECDNSFNELVIFDDYKTKLFSELSFLLNKENN